MKSHVIEQHMNENTNTFEILRSEGDIDISNELSLGHESKKLIYLYIVIKPQNLTHIAMQWVPVISVSYHTPCQKARIRRFPLAEIQLF